MSSSGICQCGCGEPTALVRMTDTKRGAVKGQPRRFRPYHHQRTKRATHAVDPETGCWNWQGHITDRGYPGLVRFRGKFERAHRAKYMEHVGPIPAGLELDHLCFNRRCVNPAHLEPVTHDVNMQRSSHAHLTPAQVAEIRALPRPAWGQRSAVAARFGISASQFDDIRTGRSWK